MLQGIEEIFENKEEMLKHLKKKSFEKNTQEFLAKHGHYFAEMAAYIAQSDEKAKVAEELGECIVEAVKHKFENKRGKIDGRTQIDLNFFMIYYVFPSILNAGEDGTIIADGICNVWKKSFKDGNIEYTDYDTLYNSFREKIFGIF